MEAAFAAFDAFDAAVGRLDAVYSVAGISGRRYGDGPLHEATLEGWETVLAAERDLAVPRRAGGGPADAGPGSRRLGRLGAPCC